MYNADVEVIDVEAIASSRRFAESVDAREQVIEEPKLSMDIVESRNMYDGQKVQDLVHRVDEATDSNASLSSTGEKLSSRQDYEMQRESLNEDIERNESGFRSKKGRRTKLVCVGSLLDDESNREDLSISSRSARSSIKSEFISADGMQNSPSRPTSTTVSYEQERNDDTQSTTSDDENRMNTLSINVGPHRKNEIDRCSSFGKPELPRVGRDEGDETSSREKEDAERKKLEKRRKRWKRRILAEHRRRQSMGGCSVSLPGNEEQPLGASLNEIEMMNTFLAVAGPNFDGSLSAKEMEELHDRSRNAGLPVEFTNRMLDQAAGIFMCDGNNDSKLPIKQGSRIAESLPMRDNEVPSIPPPLSTNNNTYDEAGFTRKTPKEHSALDCFKSTFLAESSNIVGGDMIENIQAAVSGDSSDTKSGWRSLDMIENIKASLSGDSSDQKGGWRSIDIIGSVKATLSGDSSDNKTGWRSSNVFESIKTALSGDSESKRKSVSSENGILKPHAAPRDKSPEIENSNTYSSWPSAPIVDIVHDGDELNESGLHEC
ncbi:unnamed protein product [Pseudo-nitzschia multistriata]|uniref:Uncharacterized protein n=1 Tax=Pseudo-nitzschia multistriata TaxID=183589 RepID=A0A448Z2Q2_9STRA|nr:unnamed protein product [Pseudo-nitzschia multistriata]